MEVSDRNYIDEPIIWSGSTDPEYPYEAVYDGKTLTLKVNDFPEEHFYTLLVDSQVVASFDEWPDTWTRGDGEDLPGNELDESELVKTGNRSDEFPWQVVFPVNPQENLGQFTNLFLSCLDYYSAQVQPPNISVHASLRERVAELKKEHFGHSANFEHVRQLKRGVEAWNTWRHDNPHIKPDLSGFDFSCAQLSGINLSRTFLIGANLQGCDLTNARLDNCNLSAAVFVGANLAGAVLANSILTLTNLAHANLLNALLTDIDCFRTSFLKAHLVSASFSASNLFETDLSGADLRECKFAYSRLVNCKFRDANLSDCYVYGASIWNVDLSNALQSNLSITRWGESRILVDNIEFAQFAVSLLQSPGFQDVINSVNSQAVLVLGHFQPSRNSILDALRHGLRKHNYTPIIIEFSEFSRRDVSRNIAVLSRIARFLIVDVSESNQFVAQLNSLAQHLTIPIQPIFEGTARKHRGLRNEIHSDLLLEGSSYNNADQLSLLLKDQLIPEAEASVHTSSPDS